MMRRKEPITYQQLMADIEKLTPEQRAMPVIWSGDEHGGAIQGTDVLTEDHVNPSGDGMEPISRYQPGGDGYEEGMDIENEPVVAHKGQMLLLTDIWEEIPG